MKERFSPYIPQLGERAFIVGQTGSGKTAFSTFLLERVEVAPIFIFDTKDESKFLALPRQIIVSSMEQAAIAYRNEEIDYIIIRPDPYLIGSPEQLDDMLFYAYMHFRHCVIYIDEVGQFHNNNRAYKGLINLLARGRSRGITTIMSTQRPKSIARSIITEANKFYIFRLIDRDDRKRLGDVIPNFDTYPLPPKYGFYFYESGEDQAQIFGPVKLDSKLNTGYVDEQSIQVQASPDDAVGEAVEVKPHFWL